MTGSAREFTAGRKNLTGLFYLLLYRLLNLSESVVQYTERFLAPVRRSGTTLDEPVYTRIEGLIGALGKPTLSSLYNRLHIGSRYARIVVLAVSNGLICQVRSSRVVFSGMIRE